MKMFNKIPYTIQALDSNVCYQVVHEFVSSSGHLLPFEERAERIALWDTLLREFQVNIQWPLISRSL